MKKSFTRRWLNMTDRKIIKYKTIFVADKAIDEEVNDAILMGWQPFGGLSVTWHNDDETDVSYCQVMVKYEP